MSGLSCSAAMANKIESLAFGKRVFCAARFSAQGLFSVGVMMVMGAVAVMSVSRGCFPVGIPRQARAWAFPWVTDMCPQVGEHIKGEARERPRGFLVIPTSQAGQAEARRMPVATRLPGPPPNSRRGDVRARGRLHGAIRRGPSGVANVISLRPATAPDRRKRRAARAFP
jgi:hypothetical protein